MAQPRQRFSGLTLDKANHLWAATDSGMYRMDEQGWHRIDPGLSGLIPTQIAAGADGIFWTSGTFAGVLRLRIAGDRVVESEHLRRPHLLSDQVICAVGGHRGWLWVGQDAGLSVFDGQTWRSFTQGRA